MRVKRYVVRPRLVLYLVLLLAAAMLIAAVASAQLTNFADPLNYDGARNHTISVTWSEPTYANLTCYVPATFTFVTSINCSITGTEVLCTNISNATVNMIFQSNPTNTEFTLSNLACNATNGTAYNATPVIKFLKIDDHRIFNTLIEYGRGRGNYFYNTFGSTATSGRTYQACPYVPNATDFELNYLHKVFNIMQYYGFAEAQNKAVNASFGCVYNTTAFPRQHLTTQLANIGGLIYANYSISEVGGSWERMGFFSADWLKTQLNVSSRISTNCSNLTYTIPGLGGKVVVNQDNFTLDVRNREPFIVNASASAGVIGNGTQEVLITYNITNTELYPTTSISIDIEAPRNAMFIGTRGELWGTALDQFHLEKNELLAGEQEIVTLAARFNTTSESDITSLALGGLVRVKFITCWEQFAYNPADYIQRIPVNNNITVNMSMQKTIIGIPEILILINSTNTNIQNTLIIINSTTQSIHNITLAINQTLIQLNNTVNALFNLTINISADIDGVFGNLTLILDMLNCSLNNNGINSSMCNMLANISQMLANINRTVIEINISVHNITVNASFNFTIAVNLTALNESIENIRTNVSLILNQTTFIILLNNCTNVQFPNSTCYVLNQTQESIFIMNNTVNNIFAFVQFINNTQFGNISTTVLYNLIINRTSNIEGAISNITTQMLVMRQFDEELVFLVTDAFNSQQAAREDVNNGDFPASVTRLQQAQERLNQAAERLARLQTSVQDKPAVPQTIVIEAPAEKGSKDYLFLVLLLAGIVLLVVYFRRRSQE